MSKRKWTNISMFGTENEQMRRDGLTRQEIADSLGLTKVQIKNWINRTNRAEAYTVQGKAAKPKGGPRKDGKSPQQDIQKELKRLQMENKLLRDFLQSTGRK